MRAIQQQNTDPKVVDGKRMPSTEETGLPITTLKGNYRPMAYGPLGRAWKDRAKWAGTYDQRWQDEVFPFLPDDFSEKYFQAAPEDQQTDYLRGGEEVELLHLTPGGRVTFKLPDLTLPISYYEPRSSEAHPLQAQADTLLLEPELNRFCVTWRVRQPLKKNLMEIAQVTVGRMNAAWLRARETGKQYLHTLAELDQAEEKRR